MLIPGQLRLDSSLRCGSENSCFGARIWAFGFPTQKCLDELSGHTIRSLSKTLGMNRKPFGEREKESKRTHNVAFPLGVLF